MDLNELDRLYADLHRKSHPDLSFHKQGLPDAAQINFAYKILSDPSLRAFHLLQLHGVSVERYKGMQDLLFYVCQANEELESLQSRASIKAFIDEKESRAQAIVRRLAALALPEELDAFARAAIELKYICNLLANAKLKA